MIKRVRLATARFIAVVDGDTVHTELDIGWGIKIPPRLEPSSGLGTLRIVGRNGERYDAPERDTEAGQVAKGRLTTILVEAFPSGTFEIVSHGLDERKVRTLASIQLPDGRDLAAVMISEGFVK